MTVFPSPALSRIVVSSSKKKCLFDTLHVKPALALLTVVYLLVLAFFDLFLYAFEMSEFAYMMFSVCSIGFVGAILIAQYGLFSENHYLVLPFFASQSIFTLVVCYVFFRQMAVEFYLAQVQPKVFMRLTLLMLHEIILTMMQGYALIVTWRCMNYLYYKGHVKMQESSIVCNRRLVYGTPNRSNIKKKSVSLRIDMSTDEEGNSKVREQNTKNPIAGAPVGSRASILVKHAGEQDNKNGNSIQPSCSIKRQVSFADGDAQDISF